MENELITLHERYSGFRHMFDTYELRRIFEDSHGAIVVLYDGNAGQSNSMLKVNETLNEVVNAIQEVHEKRDTQNREEDEARSLPWKEKEVEKIAIVAEKVVANNNSCVNCTCQ